MDGNNLQVVFRCRGGCWNDPGTWWGTRQRAHTAPSCRSRAALAFVSWETTSSSVTTASGTKTSPVVLVSSLVLSESHCRHCCRCGQHQTTSPPPYPHPQVPPSIDGGATSMPVQRPCFATSRIDKKSWTTGSLTTWNRMAFPQRVEMDFRHCKRNIFSHNETSWRTVNRVDFPVQTVGPASALLWRHLYLWVSWSWLWPALYWELRSFCYSFWWSSFSRYATKETDALTGATITTPRGARRTQTNWTSPPTTPGNRIFWMGVGTTRTCMKGLVPLENRIFPHQLKRKQFVMNPRTLFVAADQTIQTQVQLLVKARAVWPP